MPRRKMWVEWEDGANLSQSQKKPGDYSPLTRDSDHNLGHVTLSDIDGDEQDDAEDQEAVYVYLNSYEEDSEEQEDYDEEVIAALLTIGAVIAQAAAPHVKKWWREQALPFLKSKRNRFPWSRATVAQDRTFASLVAGENVFADPSHEALLAIEEYKITMTGAEARERLAAALSARLFFEEQIRVLRTARIQDGNGAQELVGSMEGLTPQQLADGVVLMLEANPSLLDQEASAALLTILEAHHLAAERSPLGKAEP